jgi:hypothetical protein
MSSIDSNKVANATFASSAGLLSLAQTIDLPANLIGVGEPIGLVLALIGTVLKLVQFFSSKK